MASAVHRVTQLQDNYGGSTIFEWLQNEGVDFKLG